MTVAGVETGTSRHTAETGAVTTTGASGRPCHLVKVEQRKRVYTVRSKYRLKCIARIVDRIREKALKAIDTEKGHLQDTTSFRITRFTRTHLIPSRDEQPTQLNILKVRKCSTDFVSHLILHRRIGTLTIENIRSYAMSERNMYKSLRM